MAFTVSVAASSSRWYTTATVATGLCQFLADATADAAATPAYQGHPPVEFSVRHAGDPTNQHQCQAGRSGGEIQTHTAHRISH